MVLIMLLLVISGWVLEMFFLSVPGGSGTQLVGGQKRPSSQLSSFPLRFDLSQKLTPRQLTQPTERRRRVFLNRRGKNFHRRSALKLRKLILSYNTMSLVQFVTTFHHAGGVVFADVKTAINNVFAPKPPVGCFKKSPRSNPTEQNVCRESPVLNNCINMLGRISEASASIIMI